MLKKGILKNRIFILLFCFLSSFLFTKSVSARVYYFDLQYNELSSSFNILNELIKKDARLEDSSLTYHSVADLIMQKGSGLLSYYSSLYSLYTSNTYTFDSIGFVSPLTLPKIAANGVSFPIQPLINDVESKINTLKISYLVFLYVKPTLNLKSNSNYINLNYDTLCVLYINGDGDIVGSYKLNSSLNYAGPINFTYSTFNDLQIGCASNDYDVYGNSISEGYACNDKTKNNDLSILLSMLFAKRSGYKISVSMDTDDRAIVESVYYRGVKYTLSDKKQYSFWKKVWSGISGIWDLSPSISHNLTLTLSKYQSNPIMSSSSGFVTPYEAIFNNEQSSLPSDFFLNSASVDLSTNYHGYFFVPISSTDFAPSDIEFYFQRTSYEQSLLASALDSSSGTLVPQGMYMSYVLTKDTMQAYTYYNFYGSTFNKDINLSMGQDKYNYSYKTHVIHMFTDFSNSSFFVYYDKTKFKLVKADSNSSTISVYSKNITTNYDKLRDNLYKKAQDFVGYNGNLYDLGSTIYDGVFESGFDNWRDCEANKCIENSIEITDDITKTNIWQRNGWKGIDDILSSSWDNIQSLLGSVSAIVLMFNTFFSALPPIISSAFVFVFMTGMVLILLKILL